MYNKSYTSTHNSIDTYRKGDTAHKTSKMDQVDLQQMANMFIQEQKNKTREIQFQIRAYEVQIDAQKNCRVDHGPFIESVQRQIQEIRNQETYINEQIRNCQNVQGQVTPMQYYLWKKKQRINTYDVSIAELCKQIQTERQELQQSAQEFRHEGQEIAMEIQHIQDRLSQLNSSSGDILAKPRQISEDVDSYQELFTRNVDLKQQYSSLNSTHEILQQNKDIVAMQISDNIKSIQSSLKNYFDGEKIKLVKQFKQIQLQSKSWQISPLNSEQQSYKIDPLLTDYAYKLKQMYGTAPEQIKKVVSSILEPLSWEKFFWRDFLEVEPKSEHIYSQYRKLQEEYMNNQSQIQKLQQQLKEISHQLVMQQMRSTQLSENIRKLRKKMKK